jgi:hypothetical protein
MCARVLLQGELDGEQVVVKLFETKQRGAVQAFCQELQAYHKLHDLQGPSLPRLLLYGMFAHTGALFLVLTDEGDNLESCEDPFTQEMYDQMVDAITALHRCGLACSTARDTEMDGACTRETANSELVWLRVCLI